MKKVEKKGTFLAGTFLMTMGLFINVAATAQYKLESLTGPERPFLKNPQAFSDSLKARGTDILIQRIGRKKFEEWIDTTYLYPHYYNNVYFNTAPSERNYRVFFRARPGILQVFDFELTFSQGTLALMSPVEGILPDCRTFPSGCYLLDVETIREIAKKEVRYLRNTEGTFHFSFDSAQQTFVWHYTVQRMGQYPRGEKEEVFLDAAKGFVLKRSYDPEYYMGR
jgi:hypothetical protein